MNFIFQTMAGIDKLYIDGKEYPLYRQWWIDNYDKMIKELGEAIWLYPFDLYDYPSDVTPEYLKCHEDDIKEMRGIYNYPIWNTSERVDLWLIDNCPFESFRNRMLEVYSSKWKGFKGQKWVPKKKEKPKYIR